MALIMKVWAVFLKLASNLLCVTEMSQRQFIEIYRKSGYNLLTQCETCACLIQHKDNIYAGVEVAQYLLQQLWVSIFVFISKTIIIFFALLLLKVDSKRFFFFLQGSAALCRRDRRRQGSKSRQQDGNVNLLCHLLCCLPLLLCQHLCGSHHHHVPRAGG